jgi:hypothetical protein
MKKNLLETIEIVSFIHSLVVLYAYFLHFIRTNELFLYFYKNIQFNKRRAFISVCVRNK